MLYSSTQADGMHTDACATHLQFFDPSLQILDLPLNSLPAGPTDRIPLLYTILEIEHTFNHIGFKLVREFTVLLESNVREVAFVLLRQGNGTTGDVVSLPEGNLRA